MKTQEQLDIEYECWLVRVGEAVRIRNAIIKSGGMATKTAVEDRLMPLYGIDRSEAHTIMNYIEYHNLK